MKINELIKLQIILMNQQSCMFSSQEDISFLLTFLFKIKRYYKLLFDLKKLSNANNSDLKINKTHFELFHY